MSFFSALSSLVGQQSGESQQPSPEQHASAAQALVQHFDSQPGGLSSLVNQFRQNGMGGHVDGWMSSQVGAQPAQQLQPQQVEQGVGGGAIESIASRAGMSPEMTKIALATALPMLMAHLSGGSGQLPAQASQGGGLAGMAESLFSRAI